MVFRVSSLALWLFLLPLLTLHQPALGADATSFDPTQVAVKAKGAGGVPVGTIIPGQLPLIRKIWITGWNVTDNPYHSQFTRNSLRF